MKFKIVKRFSLDFLGEEWKDCYINFKPLSISDLKIKLPEISKLKENEADVNAGVELLLNLVAEKFISGKVIDEKGQVVDLPVDSLKDLPMDVIGRAFSFLSEAGLPTSIKP